MTGADSHRSNRLALEDLWLLCGRASLSLANPSLNSSRRRCGHVSVAFLGGKWSRNVYGTPTSTGDKEHAHRRRAHLLAFNPHLAHIFPLGPENGAVPEDISAVYR
jgi:hypothetical protein